MMVPSRYIGCQLLGWYWAGYNGYDIAKWLFDSIVAVDAAEDIEKMKNYLLKCSNVMQEM
jgi:cyclopropane fatty-acyl-phospholipid synthase-like methyltransferase